MPTVKYNLLDAEKFSQKTVDFLTALHAGGQFAYFWTLSDKLTTWWEVGDPLPAIPQIKDVFFGVHPTTTIQADPAKPAEEQRARIATVAAVNCLFAEFDQKDGWTFEKVEALTLRPSVLISSGGGWHAYWITREPWIIQSEAERRYLADLQARWVKLVGSDPGAKDLARVLRVPGTLNCKYDPPRPVEFVWCELWRLYDMAEMEAYLPEPEPEPAPEPQRPLSNSERVPELRAAAILRSCKAQMSVGNRNSLTFWFACRCNDFGLPPGDAERLAFELAGPAGLAEREILATVRSAYTQTPDPSRAAPPMPAHDADHQVVPENAGDQVGPTEELSISPELDDVAKKRIQEAFGGVKKSECGMWVIRPRIAGGKAIKFQIHCGHCDACIKRRADRYQKLVQEKILSGLPLLLARSLDDLKTPSGKRSRQCETFELLQGVGQEYYTCWPLGPDKSALLVVETEILPDARHLAEPLGIAEFNALPFDFWIGMAKGETKRRVSGRLLTAADEEPPDETETPTGEIFQVCAFSGAREGDIVKAASAVREKLAVTAQDREAFQGYLDTLGTRMLVWLQTHGTPRARMWKLRARIDREAVATNHIGLNLNTRLIARICDENDLEPWKECEIPINPD
jgi:hypothetical protein